MTILCTVHQTMKLNKCWTRNFTINIKYFDFVTFNIIHIHIVTMRHLRLHSKPISTVGVAPHIVYLFCYSMVGVASFQNGHH
jgi:hypothetical protein